MKLDPEGSGGEEVGYRGDGERNSSEEWRASSYRSVVTGAMLASSRAKYGIPSSVEMMEGHIASDLYGEALLQSSTESCPTSAADYTLNDAQDNGFDGWCDEDGSSCEWESKRICNQFVTIGYREGLMAGQEASAQDGFNSGFKLSVSTGYNLGIVRGITSAMNCLPNELKERLVETEEKRNKLKQLHESVHSLSTSDALKLFHEEQTRTSAMNPNPDITQISDVVVLKNYYKELQSFISETPAIEVCLDMMKQ